MFDLTLTFDNGPEPSVTPSVLDVLAKHEIQTTFFVIGRKLQDKASRACAERAHAEGHGIGNHTWTHSRPLGEQPGRAAADLEIGRTQAAIEEFSSRPPLFRPMGGGGNLDKRLLSADAAAFLQAGGYTCVLWNAVPRDWIDVDGWVDRALRQIEARPWTLMVLHDVASGAMHHLDRFISEVRALGVRMRQDFPSTCMPIKAGNAAADLADFVT